jgi:NTE family protein
MSPAARSRALRPRETRRRARHTRTLGIALGSGGARGLAHLGVVRRLTDSGIPIDAVVGTSIGAIVGAMLAAGQLEGFERQMRELEWQDMLRMLDPVWPRTGLVSGERLVDWLGALVGDWRIEDLAIPYAAVSVDLVSGDEIVIREGRVIEAIRASISIPGVFVPYPSGERLLVDGALRNPVPVSALDAFDVDVRVASNLHSHPVREIVPASERRIRGPVAARVVEAIENRLARFRRGQPSSSSDPSAAGSDLEGGVSPNLFEVLTSSMMLTAHELTRYRLAAEAVDLVLEPDVRSIRSFEYHRAAEAIDAGDAEALRRLPELERLLR